MLTINARKLSSVPAKESVPVSSLEISLFSSPAVLIIPDIVLFVKRVVLPARARLPLTAWKNKCVTI